MSPNTPARLLHTRRLLLRPPRLSDARAIFERYARDPEVTRYLLWRPHRTIADTRAFLRFCASEWKGRTNFTWVLLRSSDRALMGMINLRPRGHAFEAGYVLARPDWGRGYMTEALRAVIREAFRQPGIFRVAAACDVANAASARVMEKAGMAREGRLRRYAVHPNVGVKPRDSLLYAITR